LRPRFVILAALLIAQTACVRRIVVNAAADALSGQSSFATDDDPELVRDALPFGLKTMEALLASAPGDRRLLLAVSSGFAQYAYGFLAFDADRLEEKDPAAAMAIRARARRLLDRAIGYARRGMDAAYPGFTADFDKDRRVAVARLKIEDVPQLYWLGAAMGARLTLSRDDMKIVGSMPDIEALMQRALELDEGWEEGTIHEFFVSWDGGRSEAMGGSLERAKKHLNRVQELSHGRKLSPLVTWAESVAVGRQDRAEFDELLGKVLAADVNEEPRLRLVNTLAQQRARWLQSRADDLFL